MPPLLSLGCGPAVSKKCISQRTLPYRSQLKGMLMVHARACPQVNCLNGPAEKATASYSIFKQAAVDASFMASNSAEQNSDQIDDSYICTTHMAANALWLVLQVGSVHINDLHNLHSSKCCLSCAVPWWFACLSSRGSRERPGRPHQRE